MNLLSLACHLGALLALPVVMLGLINRVKSLWAGRRGPRVLQPMFDMRRLLRKRPVYSAVAGPVFRLGPVVALTTALVGGAVIPLVGGASPVSFAYDFVFFAYVLGLGRIFMVIAALDTGSPFEGMGASREATYGALVEPVLFAVLGALLITTGGDDLGALLSATDPTAGGAVIEALCALALLVILQVEAARIPVDDPMTHLELTMIHEVMILDHSGPDLAALQYAAGLKITIYAGMIAALVNPVPWSDPWLAVGVQIALMLGVAVVVGTIESIVARLRMRAIPLYIGAAGVAALAALVLAVLHRGGAL